MKKRKTLKVVTNNKMKAYGSYDPKTNVIEINKKKHKGDQAELADTINHEMLHAKHPDMSEREVKKKASSYVPVSSNMKSIHYKMGAMKRKFKMTASDEIKPGSFIEKAREYNNQFINDVQDNDLSVEDVAIMGLI